jgi:hypothetical protein
MLGKFKAFGYDYDVGFFLDEETFFILLQITPHRGVGGNLDILVDDNHIDFKIFANFYSVHQQRLDSRIDKIAQGKIN